MTGGGRSTWCDVVGCSHSSEWPSPLVVTRQSLRLCLNAGRSLGGAETVPEAQLTLPGRPWLSSAMCKGFPARGSTQMTGSSVSCTLEGSHSRRDGTEPALSGMPSTVSGRSIDSEASFRCTSPSQAGPCIPLAESSRGASSQKYSTVFAYPTRAHPWAALGFRV